MSAPASSSVWLSGRPAARLLLWCARRFVRGDDDTATQLPPLAGFDGDEWSFLMRETLRHSCLPIVERTLATIDSVPASIREDLAKAFEANGRRNLRLGGELVSATRALLARLRAPAAELRNWLCPVLPAL